MTKQTKTTTIKKEVPKQVNENREKLIETKPKKNEPKVEPGQSCSKVRDARTKMDFGGMMKIKVGPPQVSSGVGVSSRPLALLCCILVLGHFSVWAHLVFVLPPRALSFDYNAS